MTVILPASVLTTHLESCAAGLATTPPADEDLAEVITALVSGQRHLAVALARLADTRTGPLAEILDAAARATEHAAAALAEGERMFE